MSVAVVLSHTVCFCAINMSISFFWHIELYSYRAGRSQLISEFLRQYYGVDPQTVGAPVVGRFWGYMSLGCLLGLLLLRLFDSRTVLKGAGATAIACLLAALFGPVDVALHAFPAVGFAISVMFSTIMSLGLNSVDRYHGSFAGILCTGIAGGALWSASCRLAW